MITVLLGAILSLTLIPVSYAQTLGGLSTEDTALYYRLTGGGASTNDRRVAVERGYEYQKKGMYREASALYAGASSGGEDNAVAEYYHAANEAEWFLNDAQDWAEFWRNETKSDKALGVRTIIRALSDVILGNGLITRPQQQNAKTLCRRLLNAYADVSPNPSDYDIERYRKECEGG